ncbi:MAG TPA: Ger(x)C family spore germination C-terminal domain-containing protein [Clostridia bacterium]|nr:Ger(x)C family spore germination C-terminal domain-containing protein [Clostridia bacterium]
MKKKVKRLFFIISIYLTVFFSLSGCWNSRELNELSIVTGIGIDKAEIPGNILVTAQIVKPADIKKSSKDGGGSDTAFWNIKSSSKTVFDAIREFTHETSNKLYVAHTQVIILGRDIAPDGVQKYLDFFMRSHETRPTTIILVSDSTACEVLDVKPDGKATMEINTAESKVTPEIKNNKPYVSIKIKASTSMVNQTSHENLATMPGFSLLEQHQNDVIKDEIKAVLKKAKDMNTDIFGFGDIFKKKFKSKWKTMEDNWDTEFPDLNVEIKIESKIRASGLIIKPAVPESEPEKE